MRRRIFTRSGKYAKFLYEIVDGKLRMCGIITPLESPRFDGIGFKEYKFHYDLLKKNIPESYSFEIVMKYQKMIRSRIEYEFD